MTMVSKYKSSCKSCGFVIEVGDSINWSRGSGATHVDCKAAKEKWDLKMASAPKPIESVNLSPIAEFLKAAQSRGLKSPKLRVLSTDEKSELRLSITRAGVAPGSIAVALNGEFVGCVRPSGAVTSNLAKDTAMQAHLLHVAENPASATKQYAALMGLCSFCGKQLTDAGSVEVGYGPVCADKWGLPHTYYGTPTLHPVAKA